MVFTHCSLKCSDFRHDSSGWDKNVQFSFTLFFLGLIKMPFVSKWHTPLTPCWCKNVLISWQAVPLLEKQKNHSNLDSIYWKEKGFQLLCYCPKRLAHENRAGADKQSRKYLLPLRSLLNCFSSLSSQSEDVNLLTKWWLSLFFLNTIKSVSHVILQSLCDCRRGIIICGNRYMCSWSIVGKFSR